MSFPIKFCVVFCPLTTLVQLFVCLGQQRDDEAPGLLGP